MEDAEAAPEEIAVESVEGTEVSFTADSFSYYIVSSLTTADDPDTTYIVVEKTFTGILSSQINDAFAIEVKDASNSTVATLNSANTETKSSDGLTWTWKVNVQAGTHNVSESSAEVGGYDLVATGTGASVTTQPSNMVFTEPAITPNCNFNDYNIGAVNLICAQLTKSAGYFVWSYKTLSANQRAAVIAYMNGAKAGFSGAAESNTFFYSGDKIEDIDGLYFRGSYIKYDGVDILHFSDPAQWAKFFTANYSFSTPETPEISISNAYTRQASCLTVAKTVTYDSAKSQAPSGGQTFTFQIDPQRKEKMLKGLDAIGETLQAAAAIDVYEMKRALAQPWLEEA
jgi:hypothetical protein